MACAALCGSSATAAGFGTDSLHTNELKVVTIDGTKSQATRVAMPTQVMKSNDFVRYNAAGVSDAVKHFAGATVKDYGGIGGLKTVSVRSLGAQHTAVAYDGITLNDSQTGQIDLSRFSLENVETLSLSNGQPDDIFQTARMFAAAGVLNIVTKSPEFGQNRRKERQITLKTGSFGLFNLTYARTKSFGKRVVLSWNSDWLSAKGDYPYTLHYGGEKDSSARKNRTNSDVRTFRNEVNGYIKLRDRELLSVKLYHYTSKRGLPGATIYYNEDSEDRVDDQNFFTQIQYENRQSQKWQSRISAKFNRSANQYDEVSNKYAGGVQENNFVQREYYLSGSLLYRPLSALSVSLATDGAYNNMQNNFAGFVYPERATLLSVLAAKYSHHRLDATVSLLHTFTHETVKSGEAAPNRNRLSPTLSLSWRPFDEKSIRLRTFYKDGFRIPTFNDLYYQRMGNPNLKPEKAKQLSIGAISNENPFSFLSEFSVSADLFYNRIEDKIVAIPKQNLFVWSMVNLDKVEIKGADICLKSVAPLSDQTELRVNGCYTYQSAHDQTAGSTTYGHQIQYTPYHSGSSAISLKTKWLEVGYSACYSGKRWSLGQNIAANRMEAYADQSLFATKKIETKSVKLNITGELLNMTDKQYEIVRNYPMPGRHFRLTVSARF